MIKNIYEIYIIKNYIYFILKYNFQYFKTK